MHYEKFADGTIKCIEDEIPFDIPESWAWAHLSDIAQILNGDRGQNYPAKNKLQDTGIPFVSASNIESGVVISNNLLCMTEAQYKSLGAGKLITNDIVYCIRGSLGKCGFFTMSKGAISSSLVIVRPFRENNVIRKYLFLYLNASLAESEIKKYDNGSAQPNLAAKDFARFLIPVPPLDELDTIVKKTDNVLMLVEQITNNKESIKNIISLTTSKILDLAIRGKLVPQNENDEPASVLLERIRAEKEELIKQGKIKRDKRESVIYRGADNSYYERFADGSEKCINKEIPFEIPKAWAWGRIFSITTDLSYGTAKKSLTKGKIAVIRMGNIQAGEINYDDLMYSSDEADILKYCLEKNDLLFNRTNSPDLVGKTAIYRGDIPAIYAGYLIRIHTFIDSEYLNIVMNSNYARRYYNLVKTDGVNQSNINAKKLAVFIIPIPPFEEQRRIAKQEKTIRSILFECMH